MFENFRSQGRTSWDNAKFGIGLGLAAAGVASGAILLTIQYEESDCKPEQPSLSATTACIGENALIAAAAPWLGTGLVAPGWNRESYLEGNRDNFGEIGNAGVLIAAGGLLIFKNRPRNPAKTTQAKSTPSTVTQP